MYYHTALIGCACLSATKKTTWKFKAEQTITYRMVWYIFWINELLIELNGSQGGMGNRLRFIVLNSWNLCCINNIYFPYFYVDIFQPIVPIEFKMSTLYQGHITQNPVSGATFCKYFYCHLLHRCCRFIKFKQRSIKAMFLYIHKTYVVVEQLSEFY